MFLGPQEISLLYSGFAVLQCDYASSIGRDQRHRLAYESEWSMQNQVPNLKDKASARSSPCSLKATRRHKCAKVQDRTQAIVRSEGSCALLFAMGWARRWSAWTAPLQPTSEGLARHRICQREESGWLTIFRTGIWDCSHSHETLLARPLPGSLQRQGFPKGPIHCRRHCSVRS